MWSSTTSYKTVPADEIRFVMKAWRVPREFTDVPDWLSDYFVAGYGGMGWAVHHYGTVVAAGKWGEHVYLMDNGGISCEAEERTQAVSYWA